MNTIKTILYMGSLHGFFTFYTPFWIATWSLSFFDLGVWRYIAFPLWILAAGIMIRCCIDIVEHGRGTPAHMDPPKEFVTTGLYRHVRNPIYLGALLALIGHILWFGSVWVMIYFLCYAIAFQTLITVFEEPVLKQKFGVRYEEYLKQVPRWFPRWK